MNIVIDEGPQNYPPVYNCILAAELEQNTTRRLSILTEIEKELSKHAG